MCNIFKRKKYKATVFNGLGENVFEGDLDKWFFDEKKKPGAYIIDIDDGVTSAKTLITIV